MSRIAIVHKDKCFPRSCGQACAKVCPMNRANKQCIMIIQEGNTAKNKEYARIDEEICTGCGICPKKCPFGAIEILNLPEKLKEAPVHRYGKNSFELFRLPIPKKNELVGILGANGIGKTTALEILSGKLRPNLGVLDREVSDQEIINSFKGSELHSYFTNLFKKKVEVSYKPQHIYEIQNLFKGKVSDLLAKFGNSAEIKKVVKSLDMDSFVSREVPKLSGGELQRTAIAIALLKKADLYFFDEPASFLDIRERIRMAKALRELSTNKQVLAVEHDLLVLDYLTDVVHIIFGKMACYGVISHPLSSKNGVNTYLEGYLRDENVRFRTEPLKFGSGGKKEDIKLAKYTSWPDIEVKLGDFSLKVDASEISGKQVVGVVGANGIGKTTFMKILAGLIKTDKKFDKLKISYKPQQIAPEKGTVRTILMSTSKESMSQQFAIDVLTPLQLDNLLDKNLNELSGGELQRVAIAVCLARDADMYLFDEPSTYLDVDQRLMVAKAIQRVVLNKERAALVIDHDLMFIHHISDKIMVFDGTPAKNGYAEKILSVEEGMNKFLKTLGITCRREPETGRPRVNKEGSVKDKEQKEKGKYYL